MRFNGPNDMKYLHLLGPPQYNDIKLFRSVCGNNDDDDDADDAKEVEPPSKLTTLFFSFTTFYFIVS